MTVAPPSESFQTEAATSFTQSIMAGLRARQKTIESKWLYDARGSQLFDTITQLDEYYPTRTELGILRKHAAELQHYVSGNTALVELGSGSSTKTRALLNTLPNLHSYVPVDISKDHLYASARHVADEYGALNVIPIVGDFTGEIPLPAELGDARKILFFPGSTIGNFQIGDAADLLAQMRQISDVVAFVVGVDLVKDTDTLIRAYDDTSGVTAAFNMNLLTRINRELGANFNLDGFKHEARWNDARSRVEMHLVSLRAQVIQIFGEEISFAVGESIHTENSHKYTPGQLEQLACENGWEADQIWTDPKQLFGVAVLTPK
ncbi:L-histidine N(alpha)-methyltransferase [Sedimentitalea sp. CY04]|uniref:L-histidine N(Alpha)-methyltransferase n=1 Tax=Parasedimentitalea denitrificans TaxID=2211118 RepID=A0ABX0WEK6_9RHOB|nr:L-histidine N(alpha)-methyltransferase [Sedimentitalea sp. CY04]NIZ63229.1 L-histidine N(alpha)-methyltransferase [Sedimentitalea sp. CY04]